jgi:3-oxoacyl-[acyl-carrier-protein] synthase-3
MSNACTIENIKILATGSCTPDTIYSNEYLSTLTGTTSEWIYNNLGIKERRIVAKGECTSDLAYRAAKIALSKANISEKDIDLIIVATTTPDRPAPSTACILQDKLKAYNAAAFDLGAVCSGFIYALTTGAQFIASGMYKNVLIVGADVFSSIVDWRRRDCVFFGDGAGAILLAQADHNDQTFMVSKLFADGRGKNAWTIGAGGSEMPASIESINANKHFFEMDGKAVFETATKVLPQAINEVLKTANIDINQIKYIIPHQPSIKILKETARALGIEFSKVLTNMDKYANTSAATIPLLLDETINNGLIQSGDYIVFAAVGSGWTWGATLIKW